MLDILGCALRRRQLEFQRYDGAMTPMARNSSLSAFAQPCGPRVLLASLKAGNVGLNLACASRVFLVAPWFNPFVEEQAIARVDRLGQNRPVIVYKLVVSGTIEERMLVVQVR